MKYLLVLLIAAAVIWLWRHNRQADKRAAAPPRSRRPEAGQPLTEMVECEVCHVHLPRSEALIGGQGGCYCSEAHRRQAGG